MVSVPIVTVGAIVGGLALGALTASTVPTRPIVAAEAPWKEAVGNPAASTSLAANDQMPINYGSAAPMMPPQRAVMQPAPDYVPVNFEDSYRDAPQGDVDVGDDLQVDMAAQDAADAAADAQQAVAEAPPKVDAPPPVAPAVALPAT